MVVGSEHAEARRRAKGHEQFPAGRALPTSEVCVRYAHHESGAGRTSPTWAIGIGSLTMSPQCLLPAREFEPCKPEGG
jgi:hypothetical protein